MYGGLFYQKSLRILGSFHYRLCQDEVIQHPFKSLEREVIQNNGKSAKADKVHCNPFPLKYVSFNEQLFFLTLSRVGIKDYKRLLNCCCLFGMFLLQPSHIFDLIHLEGNACLAVCFHSEERQI